jgi:two-component system invasion response regulator UvrY
MMDIKIVIIDDHKLIREMWKELFNKNKNIKVVGESGDLDEAVEVIKAKRPDIALLDINLSGESGFDAMPLIRKYAPGTHVIAVSMHNQPAYTKKMLKLGAKAYITKNSSPNEMLEAIDEVMKGGKYICSEIRDIVSNQLLNEESTSPSLKDLSLRELEVVKLIRAGLSSKEIADQLKISLRTAEVHRHNILKKLKLKNSTALLNFIQHEDF